MRDDERRPIGPTYWAVDAEADRKVSERVTGQAFDLEASSDGFLRVLELPDVEGAAPSLRRVRIARTLRDELEEARHPSPAVRSELLSSFVRLCETLGRAHEAGITHGTLHPGAVALAEAGEVVVLEWDLATFADAGTPEQEAWAAHLAPYREAADLRVVPEALDVLAYLPPETLGGEIGEREAAADVYALGAILYRILTGVAPYAFQTVDELRSKARGGHVPRASHLERDAPGPLSALAARCLSPDPAERPSDADEVADAVRAWQTARRASAEASREREQISVLVAGVREFAGDAAKKRLDEAIARSRKLLKRAPEDEEAEALRLEAERMREAIRRAEREREEKTREQVERAWADATEARAALVRLEAEMEKATKAAGAERAKLDGVRNDLTRARAEAASLHKQLERMPHERDRAVAHALEAEQRRCRRLTILLGVLGVVLALLVAFAFLVAGLRTAPPQDGAALSAPRAPVEEGRPPRVSMAEAAPGHR